MSKVFILGVIALVLGGCGSVTTVKQAVNYDTEKESRIRLYGQNQKPTYMWTKIDCEAETQSEKVMVPNGLSGTFDSFIGDAENINVGIAETDISKNLSDRDGILSKAIYQEFVIPAGAPINVRTAFVGLGNTMTTSDVTVITAEGSCDSDVASFTPEAGKDYEVVGARGRACAVSVYEVDGEGNQLEIALNKAITCK